MSQVVSKHIRNKFNNYGTGQKVAAMPPSEVQEFMATHLSREYLEEMEKEKKK